MTSIDRPIARVIRAAWRGTRLPTGQRMRAAAQVPRVWMAAVLTLLLLAAISGSIHAHALDGKVVAIGDGDTVTVLDVAGVQHKVRLIGIDAPEMGQPGGYRSKESLSRLVYERNVRVEWNKRDQFGRLVGQVWTTPPDCSRCDATLDAGLAQLTMGRAWWFRRFANDQSAEDRGRYEFAEQEARDRKAGLWRYGKPVPPWEWRAGRR